MKMVMIVYNQAIDDEVMDELKCCAVDCFTKWQRVLGKGNISAPHFDSNVWPGANNVCISVVEDYLVALILEKVKQLRLRLGQEGIKAFVLPIEEVV